MKNYCIYIISNNVNDKVYIGKTKANTARRWKDHIRCANGPDEKKETIHFAMSKHKIENFSFKVLKYFEDEDVAYDAETKYIKKYNSYKYGYNETPGGRGCGSAQKLKRKQVKDLFKDYAYNDMSSHDLQKKYNLARTCILDILHRKSYLNVNIKDEIRLQVWLKLNCSYSLSKKVNVNASYIKLNEKLIKNIFKDYATGKISFLDLSKTYGVNVGNIQHILSRNTWSFIKIHPSILNKVNNILKNNKNSKIILSKEEKIIIKEKIFELFIDNFTKDDISKMVDVSKDIIVKILNNTSWINIPLKKELQKFSFKRTNLTKETVFEIIKYYCENEISLKDISIKFLINKNTMSRILQRKSWKELDFSIYDSILKLKIGKNIIYRKIDVKDYDKIVKLKDLGQNFTQIGRIFNVSREVIRYIYKINKKK